MTGALEGKIAVVTGASRGIGRAIASRYAQEGATVIICGRKQETLAEVAAETDAAPGRLVPVACHVGRADDIRRLVDSTHQQFGQIHVLVNNAATNIAQEPCLQIDEAKFDKMVEINLKSAFRLIQAVAPGMCERASGSIINIASISGLRPQLYGLLYSMTKAALIMMTQSYALELGPKGVRVNAIAPGLIKTVLSEYYWGNEERLHHQLSKQPIKHIGDPSEVAEVALLMASEKSSYMTGQCVVVDGGVLLSSI
jgi:NAD(P)-dependent dehydrogenase (short-subunit alcohol dehydrogenase family)